VCVCVRVCVCVCVCVFDGLTKKTRVFYLVYENQVERNGAGRKIKSTESNPAGFKEMGRNDGDQTSEV
jgi:hypothetical protein